VLGWIPVICIREVLIGGQPLDEVIQLLAVSAMGAFLLGWLTHSWLQYRRYGSSVCRLSGPIAIGEPFDLEIECSLPQDAGEPIVAHLGNKVSRGKSLRLIWQSESQVDAAAVTPRGAGRSAFPVRLCIPARPGYGPLWVLELRRKARGIDFRAEFTLPVRDAKSAAGEERETG
jgi:hypothetical protein